MEINYIATKALVLNTRKKGFQVSKCLDGSSLEPCGPGAPVLPLSHICICDYMYMLLFVYIDFHTNPHKKDLHLRDVDLSFLEVELFTSSSQCS